MQKGPIQKNIEGMWTRASGSRTVIIALILLHLFLVKAEILSILLNLPMLYHEAFTVTSAKISTFPPADKSTALIKYTPQSSSAEISVTSVFVLISTIFLSWKCSSWLMINLLNLDQSSNSSAVSIPICNWCLRWPYWCTLLWVRHKYLESPWQEPMNFSR